MRLPCDDVRSGIGFKSAIDANLTKLMGVLFKAADGFKVQFRDETGGHFWAIVTRGAHKIEIEGRYGQNSILAEGKKAAFVSYTVRAEANVGKQDQAENAGENVEVIGKIAGVVLSVGLVCAFLPWMMDKASRMLYCIPLSAGVVYAGRLLGAKVARMVANFIQSHGAATGLSGNEMTQANAVWQRLTNALNTATGDYPTA